MNLKYYYWYFQSVIPERICDDIVRYGKEQDKQMALTGNQNKAVKDLSELELKNIQKKRKSDVVWMSDKWIYKDINEPIAQQNIPSHSQPSSPPDSPPDSPPSFTSWLGGSS